MVDISLTSWIYHKRQNGKQKQKKSKGFLFLKTLISNFSLIHIADSPLTAVVVDLVTKLCPTLLWPHGLTVAHQAPLSMGFPRQKYWNGSHFLLQGDLPNPGIEPTPSMLLGGYTTTEPPGKPSSTYSFHYSQPYSLNRKYIFYMYPELIYFNIIQEWIDIFRLLSVFTETNSFSKQI